MEASAALVSALLHSPSFTRCAHVVFTYVNSSHQHAWPDAQSLTMRQVLGVISHTQGNVSCDLLSSGIRSSPSLLLHLQKLIASGPPRAATRLSICCRSCPQ